MVSDKREHKISPTDCAPAELERSTRCDPVRSVEATSGATAAVRLRARIEAERLNQRFLSLRTESHGRATAAGRRLGGYPGGPSRGGARAANAAERLLDSAGAVVVRADRRAPASSRRGTARVVSDQCQGQNPPGVTRRALDSLRPLANPVGPLSWQRWPYAHLLKLPMPAISSQ